MHDGVMVVLADLEQLGDLNNSVFFKYFAFIEATSLETS